MNQNKKILVIYHSPCIDGTASAWVFKHFSVKLGWPRTQIEYYPTNYDQEPPDISEYNKVYIVDFSYSEKIIREMCSKTNIILLDHHKTALDNLGSIEKIKNLDLIIDMNRSGAQITWDYISDDKARPWFIDYIGDRDLWKFELEDSKEINKALLIDGFMDINKMSELLKKSPKEFKIAGSYYIKMEKNMLTSICSKAIKKKFLGYNAYFVESPILISEVGDFLNQKNDSDFVVIWRYDYKTKKYVYSLRSTPNGVDVAEIAKKFGGGGHVQAASFNNESLI